MGVVDGCPEVLAQILVDMKGLGLDSDVFFQVYLVADKTLEASFGSFQLTFKCLKRSIISKYQLISLLRNNF